MNSSETEGLEFTIQVLQKVLVSKDNEVQRIKDLNQIQMHTLLEEIDQRDQEIDQLKNEMELLKSSKIDAIRSMQENNENKIQKLKEHHSHEIYKLNVEERKNFEMFFEKFKDYQNEIKSLNHLIKQYKQQSIRQSENIAKLSKLISKNSFRNRHKETNRNDSDAALFSHIHRTYGCNAVWALADLKSGVFKNFGPFYPDAKKRSNLVIRKNGQSAKFIDLHRRRFNICVKCVDGLETFYYNPERTRDCLAIKLCWSIGPDSFHCIHGKSCSDKTCQDVHCNLE